MNKPFMVKLGNIVNIKTGKLDANASNENGIYPFFTCSKEPLKINSYSYDCECVLVAGNGDLNVKYYNGKFDAYQRTYIIESKDKNILYVPYLYYFLDSYVDILREQSIGGVIKYIKLGNLTGAKIPILPIEEQHHIAEVLDKVTAQIDNCKKILQNLDLLVKSKFVQMFGDPVSNKHNFDIKLIGDIITDIKYGTSKPAVENGKYSYIRMNNITYSGYLDLNNLKKINIPDDEVEKCIVYNGDILFNRTNSAELVGKTCVFELDTPMIIAGYIIRLRLKKEVSPKYFSIFMNTKYMKNLLFNMGKGAVNQSNINAKELQSIKIIVPPIELQNQFAEFVENVEKQKTTTQNTLNQLETLKNALMQEYFS